MCKQAFRCKRNSITADHFVSELFKHSLLIENKLHYDPPFLGSNHLKTEKMARN